MKHRNNNQYQEQRKRLLHIIELIKNETSKVNLSSRDELNDAAANIKLVLAAIDAEESNRAFINDTDRRL